jgi:hypothetical protein
LLQINLKLTAIELRILTGLVADQLFRKEFIDCRLPGFKSNAPELSIGKQLVERMKLAAGGPAARKPTLVSPIANATGRHNL